MPARGNGLLRQKPIKGLANVDVKKGSSLLKSPGFPFNLVNSDLLLSGPTTGRIEAVSKQLREVMVKFLSKTLT